MAKKLTAVIIEAYHCCQLHTKFHQTFKYSVFYFMVSMFSPTVLTSLRLSSFTTLGSCSHCSLNIPHQTSVYDDLIHNNIHIHGPKFGVLSNIVTCPFVSPLLCKFSRAANLFLILTGYCSLTSN
jgi:hypothetical protein